ncbi:MAG TPA: GNAT family N-acetyltransferase [Pyrinomonadaceae bacterium]|jgi:ribosomal protein S18 acetylase RimI-like enzyme|nr:GNAT family N-acetyltransferase [Pyrinomonadaceae bacterium]
MTEEAKPEINLRLADERDVRAIAEFNRAMARETEALELSFETLMAGVGNLLAQAQYGFYVIAEAVAENGTEAVGSLLVTYEWSDWRDGLFWWIQSVYVTPEFRRRGVYRRLYEFVKTLAARDPRVRGFRLYVERQNTLAQQTYERLGMSETHYLMYEELRES